ncbi:MAG: hypothetical protein PHV32_11030 [Eubacteriales bacterium]|nr:hypothetical protein [Eubacteriales bacterium]
MDTYYPAIGTTLLQFAARNMENAVHDYLRKNAGIFLLADKYYQNLRKVSAIYYRDRDTLSCDQRIEAIIRETGFTLKQVLRYIEHGSWFRYPENIASNISAFVEAKLTPNKFSAPDRLVPHKLFVETYFKMVESLRLRDRELRLIISAL